jgi:hypothetical protein
MDSAGAYKMNQNKPIPSLDEYEEAYRAALSCRYPEVDAYAGTKSAYIDRMARELACPVKVNPANWQHGRIIYAAAKRYLETSKEDFYNFVDIGTAKGFSAMCMDAAACYARAMGIIDSIDVVDPYALVRRNSVLECAGARFTVPEFTRPYRNGAFAIKWHGRGSQEYFVQSLAPARIHFAFVDGKHTFEAVMGEANAIAMRQKKGDIMILDDVQIAPIARALASINTHDFKLIRAGFKIVAVGTRL